MKKWTLIIAMAFVLAASSVWAANNGANNDTVNNKMQDTVYGAQIDSKIAFYQKRLYLLDSDYKLLADIGKDAVKRIVFLKTNRQNLVEKMATENISFTRTGMDSFLGKEMHSANLTTMFMEAYSSGN